MRSKSIYCTCFLLIVIDKTFFTSSTAIESKTTHSGSNEPVLKCEEWSPNTIPCKEKKLDLGAIGCTDSNDTISLSRQCSSPKTRNLDCKICRKYGDWSEWSKCCNKTCSVAFVGEVPPYKRIRYRNLSSDCLGQFQIDRSCSFEVEHNICKDGGGRAASGNTPDKDASSPVLQSSTKIIIFTVAGVIMVGLFGFAGVRLVKTMYLHPVRTKRRRARVISTGSQFSNASFRDPASPVETEERSNLVIVNQRGHRMVPPITRLSVIQEEDCNSSQQNVQVSPSSPTLLNKDMDDSNALDYMDDVLTQIEDDERALGNDSFRNSITEEERSKLFSQYGWNPTMRTLSEKKASPVICQLRSFESNDCLAASALSLASASLLDATNGSVACWETSKATSFSSPQNTSTICGSESCYSLKDISEDDCDPGWQRQYSSEPDVFRMKHVIPDIDEVLGASDCDSDVFVNDSRT